MQSSAAMSAQNPGAKPPLKSFRRMKDMDLDLWASVLCHQPPPNSTWWNHYKSTTKDQISRLPDQLRAYPSHFQRLMNKSQNVRSRAEARNLCPLHDKMNRTLARSTLGWIKVEVDVNIPAVLFPLFKNNILEEDISVYFEPLKEVTGMWTTPKKYEEAWGSILKPKWVYQEDHCAACVLARFASDVKVVTAFKAGLIARRLDEFRGGKPSKRFTYVNLLLSHFPNSEGASQKADQVGKHVQRALEQFKENKRNRDQVQLSYKLSVDRRFRIVSPPTSPTSEKPQLRVNTNGFDRPTSKADDSFPSMYSPVPIRPHSGERAGRDPISQLIDQYRRTVWEPMFGNEDSSGFEADDPAERAAVATAINWNEHDEGDLTAKDESSLRSGRTRVNPYSWEAGEEKRMSMRRETQFSDFF